MTFNEIWAGRERLKYGLLPMFTKDGLYPWQELGAKFCVDCGHCTVERRSKMSLEIRTERLNGRLVLLKAC